MQHNLIRVFLVSLALFVFAVSTSAQEQPSMRTIVNSPGWITVYWEHTGQDVYYFVIEREDPPYAENSALLIGQSYNRTDSLVDKNLKAATTYHYHVCAVYANSRTCSPWVNATTQVAPPSSGGSSGGTSPPPAHPPLRTPELTATANDAFTITLGWNTDQIYEVKNVQLSRDGQPLCDALRSKELADGGCLYERRDIVPHANTKYKYKVCFVSLYYIETKCSEEITASGKPTAPTAPANVSVSQNKSHGSASDLYARIRTLITASWSNTAIRGQFITLEREDRVQLDQIRVGPAWVEIKRVNAAGNPLDPTELTVDVTPEGPELTRQGNNYRVCAVVPSLGASGKVCSSTVVPGSETIKAVPGGVVHTPSTRPICDSARDARERNNPAAPGLEQTCLAVKKGEALASQDPLATELRNQQPDDTARQGFDIGMAVAELQTALGPGKEQKCAALHTTAEQGGCRIAVLFSVDRNRNAQYAAKGAEIAQADQGVAALRNTETDVFYRLGFDIATGIFGNPALGARGNTATGPGSLGIRDGLNPAGQRGFNASVKLHLSRKY